jgi:rhodanese-related sulfurtransferase
MISASFGNRVPRAVSFAQTRALPDSRTSVGCATHCSANGAEPRKTEVPKAIERDDVRRLIREEDAQLVDVLSREEYEDDHLPGAISLPLKELHRVAVEQLDRARPVIVHCHDYQSDMSARSAWRLEALSFGEVYDYVAVHRDQRPAGGAGQARPARARRR